MSDFIGGWERVLLLSGKKSNQKNTDLIGIDIYTLVCIK